MTYHYIHKINVTIQSCVFCIVYLSFPFDGLVYGRNLWRRTYTFGKIELVFLFYIYYDDLFEVTRGNSIPPGLRYIF